MPAVSGQRTFLMASHSSVLALSSMFVMLGSSLTSFTRYLTTVYHLKMLFNLEYDNGSLMHWKEQEEKRSTYYLLDETQEKSRSVRKCNRDSNRILYECTLDISLERML